MKLNRNKILQEMQRLGINHASLAREMGISRQLLDYYLQKDLKGFKAVEVLAKHFKIDPKDLIL